MDQFDYDNNTVMESDKTNSSNKTGTILGELKRSEINDNSSKRPAKDDLSDIAYINKSPHEYSFRPISRVGDHVKERIASNAYDAFKNSHDKDCKRSMNNTTSQFVSETAYNDYYFNTAAFLNIMWDDSITTIDDKERWIYESISTSDPHLVEVHGNDNNIKNDETLNKSKVSPLEVFTGYTFQQNITNEKALTLSDDSSKYSFHKIWGLTQKHGGPCGVLAAIQAEMIRVLLFGRNKRDGKALETNDQRRLFYYPSAPEYRSYNEDGKCKMSDHGNNELTTSWNDITAVDVKEALAMAIGMILSRASIALPASGDAVKAKGKSHVRVVFPTRENPQHTICHKVHSSTELVEITDDNQPNSYWVWEILHAASQSDTTRVDSRELKLCGLTVHTIVCPHLVDQLPSMKDSYDDIMPIDDSALPESKRQKKKIELSMEKNDPNFVHYHHEYSSSIYSSQQHEMLQLAYAVTDYLMGRNCTDDAKVGPEGKQSNSTIPLDYFQGPGGVLFFVMSLVESRTIEILRDDMDDPTTTITSQFGHSSQELINLLLTGQAVSNVFDYSMTVSGNLTCRGIQYRPAIGYLSQLESLRYCEVGGYYKSPQLPIWVIGSTSHFSVLFGDEQCVKESKSDLLLEKCRRAFKKVEGSGDSGFILAENFGELVDELDLREKLGGDHGIQTLQSYLEISGAGIILWEDTWKAFSRALTGSSIDSIILDEKGIDQQPLLVTQSSQEGKKCSATSLIQSDEELARRLAAEWGTSVQGNEIKQCAVKSDEDFARELQSQWDAEMAEYNSNHIDKRSQVATTDDMASLESMSPTPSDKELLEEEKHLIDYYLADENKLQNEKPIALATSDDMASLESTSPIPFDKEHLEEEKQLIDYYLGDENDLPHETSFITELKSPKSQFEKYGLNFPLFHYNGLRGGCLTPFRVTKLNSMEAVGASVALTATGGMLNEHSGSVGGGLEGIVRTKWPSCTFDWLGKTAPEID